MNLRIVFLFIFLFSKKLVASQSSDSLIYVSEKPEIAENVTAYIKGKKGKTYIKWKFFYKGFELVLTDTSYKIHSFSFTWSVERRNEFFLVERRIVGSKVIEDANGTEIKQEFPLSSIAPGIMITIVNIMATKDGVCYIIKPFIINTILKKEY